MKKMLNTIKFALCVVLTGCQEGQDLMKEKAGIEGQILSEQQIAAENANATKKASAMEADLSTRHRFYQAMKGTFEGDLNTGEGKYRVKITLVPSVNPYNSSRVRQLGEIEYDLNNLYFTGQIAEWNTNSPGSGEPCPIVQARPDLEKGELYIASDSCRNLYALRIAEPTTASIGFGTRAARDDSFQIARQILSGRLEQITAIVGESHRSGGSVFKLSVHRKTAE